MTEGAKTPEFFVTVALLCTAIVFVAMGEREYAGWALLGAGLGAGGSIRRYVVGRGITKSGGPQK